MLHKINALLRDKVTAKDGEVGQLADVYFDDQNWRVRYFAVDTSRWLEGRRILISPASVERSRSTPHTLALGLTREQVRRSPGIEEDISSEYEEAYARYYGLRLDWAQPEARGLSSGKIIGYSIRATDGTIGQVEDLRVEDACWEVAGLIVASRNGLQGKEVDVPPSAIAGIEWRTCEVRLRMTRDEVMRGCLAI